MLFGPNPDYYGCLYAGLHVTRAYGERRFVRESGAIQGTEIAAEVLRRRLATTGRAHLRMRGGSMRPLLNTGARVDLRPVVPGENLVGAIAAMDTGSAVVVHRVTRDDGDHIETRGIARAATDPPWPRAAVIGVARRRWLRPVAASLDAAMRVRRALLGRLR